MRGLRVVFGLGALLATPLLAQNTVRWNDVMRSLDPLEGDPPDREGLARSAHGGLG